MYYFCTYFDTNYLPRALCLFDSLERYCSAFTIYVLCLDEICYERVKKLDRPYVVPVSIEQLEAADYELLATKGHRSRVEYYYTCGPAFICYLMENYSRIEVITYLDADLYFYNSPEPLFEAFEGHSIAVARHHLPQFRKNVRQGKYNVGWINFRRDADGLACLNWWRERCIEWCYERYEDGKYADQLYLDHWPELFKGFCEFTHHGANVAGWNAGDYHFSYHDGQIYVDDDPLIFYHFHGFKKIARRIYDTKLGLTFRPPNRILKQYVFSDYIQCLKRHSEGQNPTASIRRYRPKHYILKTLIRCVIGIVFRQYIFEFNDRIV